MKSLFFTILILPNIVFAVDYSGKWEGDGTMLTKKGNRYYCEEFQLDIRQSETQIEFGNFRYTCGGYSFVFVPPKLTIKNKKEVFWNEQKIGELQNPKSVFVFKLENGGTPTYTVEITPEGVLRYQDAQIFPDGNTILDAVLIKTQP